MTEGKRIILTILAFLIPAAIFGSLTNFAFLFLIFAVSWSSKRWWVFFVALVVLPLLGGLLFKFLVKKFGLSFSQPKAAFVLALVLAGIVPAALILIGFILQVVL